MTPLLSMHGITKAYPGTLANDRVDLELMPGQIHALLGENGAGKSTLVKIIYGVLQADAGTMVWNGVPVRLGSPAEARRLGIAMVFQHFSLFDSLTVEENIALGLGPDRPADLAEEIRQVSNRYGLPLDPDRHVYTLSVGERQRIEIVRCLLQRPRLLVMDEPTSVLTPQEVEALFETLRRLRDEGVAILYISHKLDEIRELCSHATILRGGRRISDTDPRKESAQSLASMMIGQALSARASRQAAHFGAVRFACRRLSLPALDTFSVALHDIDFEVRAGQILGMAGVAGNGQDELMQAISGERRVADGSMLLLNDRPVGRLSPGARRSRGLCLVPEERLGHAAVPGMTLSENAYLTAHHRLPLRKLGLVRHRDSAAFAVQIIQRFQVACRSAAATADSLSGGNLQKFVVGREILQQPDVLVIAQPTWGVDAGAAAAIHEAILALAEQGSAILLISQDLDELMQVSHSISAICAGRASAVYPTASVSLQDVGLLMGGSQLEPQTATAAGNSR